jgi:putative FmdB family regulatory protein
MPTYQYRCTSCGNELEAVQRFTDPALTDCPDCTGQLRKVFNAVGVVFKGSGFYRTDSRSEKKSGSSASEGGSATDTKSTDSGSSTEKNTGKQPVAAGSSNGNGSSGGTASKSASSSGSSTAA